MHNSGPIPGIAVTVERARVKITSQHGEPPTPSGIDLMSSERIRIDGRRSVTIEGSITLATRSGRRRPGPAGSDAGDTDR